MCVWFSIKELNDIELRVERSIKALQDNGTLLGEEHNLQIIKKLIEETRWLREELLRHTTGKEDKKKNER